MDRYCGTNANYFEMGKSVLVFQNRMGQMLGKLRFHWMGLYWIVGVENGTFELGALIGEVLRQKVNGFRLKPYWGPTPLNLFSSRCGQNNA